MNQEAPDQPTDFATGGFLGFVGLLAAFLIFGLPQPKVSRALRVCWACCLMSVLDVLTHKCVTAYH